MGYPLSQTVLTSVYVEALSMPDPRGIQDATFLRGETDISETPPMSQILRAYCLGMLKGCSYLNERIRGEHFYEVSVSSVCFACGSAKICNRKKIL